jgi:hypothetical protein
MSLALPTFFYTGESNSAQTDVGNAAEICREATIFAIFANLKKKLGR